jgi:GT2 family glycosyltransferase
MKKILNIVINYANEEEVLSYARMLNSQSANDRISLVIVENKKSSNRKINLESELNDLNIEWDIYYPKSNLGYFNGFMYGYKKYLESAKEIPYWTILSNTDLIIDDEYAFEKLFEEEYDEKVSCIAPSIYNLNKKTYDNPKYKTRIPSKKIDSTIYIHEHPILSLMYLTLGNYKAKKNKSKKLSSQYCYALQGCFIGLKFDIMEYLQNNEFKAFLFSEENYISEMLLRLGKTCYYNSNVEIVHNEKQTTSLLGYKLRANHYADSLMFIKDEFY